jgi:Zn-dependent peptidase ImmA (M78 family)
MTPKEQACREANWFAYAFLIPEKEFLEQWEKHKGNLWAVSEYFGTTRQHTQLRARMLSLI